MADVIEIAPYAPQWALAFEAERDRLRPALHTLALRIEHNGSTSIPGCAAKPVIDIQISVRRLQPLAPYIDALATLGYTHLPHPDDVFAPFFHRPGVWPHSHHIHLVVAGGEEERRTLAFRDFLREHAEVTREYETLKRVLASQHGSVASYADAKGTFITRITEYALAAGYPRERLEVESVDR